MNAQTSRIESDYAFYQKAIDLGKWQTKQIRRQQFKQLGAFLFAMVGGLLVASFVIGVVLMLGVRL